MAEINFDSNFGDIPCNQAQTNQQQVLFDFICPKLCQYFNDYLFITNSTMTNVSFTGVTNVIAIQNQIYQYVNMVIEFFNISQFQAIGILYEQCVFNQSYSSYQAGCKVRPNTSIVWTEILNGEPSNEAGLKIPYIDQPVATNNQSLSVEDYLVNTNVTIDENLILTNR